MKFALLKNILKTSCNFFSGHFEPSRRRVCSPSGRSGPDPRPEPVRRVEVQRQADPEFVETQNGLRFRLRHARHRGG